jgi:hypothetical protein
VIAAQLAHVARKRSWFARFDGIHEIFLRITANLCLSLCEQAQKTNEYEGNAVKDFHRTQERSAPISVENQHTLYKYSAYWAIISLQNQAFFHLR